jgi:hypothetical protein
MATEGGDSSKRFLVENSPSFGVTALRRLFLGAGILSASLTTSAIVALIVESFTTNVIRNNACLAVLFLPLSGVVLSINFIGYGLANRYPDLVVTDSGITFKICWRESRIGWSEMHAVSHRLKEKRLFGNENEGDLVIYSDKLPWVYVVGGTRDVNGRNIRVSKDALRRDAFENELSQRQRMVVATY